MTQNFQKWKIWEHYFFTTKYLTTLLLIISETIFAYFPLTLTTYLTSAPLSAKYLAMLRFPFPRSSVKVKCWQEAPFSTNRLAKGKFRSFKARLRHVSPTKKIEILKSKCLYLFEISLLYYCRIMSPHNIKSSLLSHIGNKSFLPTDLITIRWLVCLRSTLPKIDRSKTDKWWIKSTNSVQRSTEAPTLYKDRL